MIVPEIQDHPAYVYNQLALRLGAIAAGVSAVAVFLIYPAPQNRIVSFCVALILVLFLAVRERLLLRMTTFRQRDLLVAFYLFPVSAVQSWVISLTPHQETPAGAA